MMIEATFSLTQDEYLEAQKLYLRATNPKQRWIFNGLRILLPLSIISVVLTSPDHLRLLMTPKVIPAFVLIALVFLTPLLQMKAFRKRFKIERPGLTNATVKLDDFGYHAEVYGRGQGAIPWSAFSSFAESPRLLLLFKGFAFYAVPKRVLDECQLKVGLNFISSHLSKLDRKLAKAQGR